MYTYTIDAVAVNPLGEWTIEYQRNPGQIFWRRILRGELVFKGDDYTLIMGKADCTPLEFIIYCDDVEYWTGEIKFPYAFFVDTDQCHLKCTPEVVDEYTCIMNNYNTEYLAALGDGVVTLVTGAGAINHFALFWFSFIRGFMSDMGCFAVADCKSSFFFEDDFPNGTPYAGAYGTNNYMTGVANRLDFLHICRNSWVRNDLGGTQCDSSETFTFKTLETWLRERFNAYWYIDQNGDFRVEHIHFFDADFPESDFEDDIDLTTMTGRCLPTFASRKNKYEYLVDKLFDQEAWSWQHYFDIEGNQLHGVDFQGEPIFYGAAAGDKSDCVPGEFKEHESPTPRLWTDYGWAMLQGAAGTADNISCNGWFLVEKTPGFNTVNTDTGALSGAAVINGFCSTANLMANFFTYDRIFLTGHMNNGATPPAVEITAFDSEIRKKLQVEIEFPHCCTTEFDPMDFIVTEMGSGAIYSAIQSNQRDSLTVKLLQ